MERTKVGTPCSVCGKPLSRRQLEVMPWTTSCSRCFVTEVIRNDRLVQLELLNGGMSVEKLAGILGKPA